MIYLQLFLSFLQVGMFSFGGGYAALPLIQGQVVKMHSWLSMSEFTDLITISQKNTDYKYCNQTPISSCKSNHIISPKCRNEN